MLFIKLTGELFNVQCRGTILELACTKKVVFKSDRLMHLTRAKNVIRPINLSILVDYLIIRPVEGLDCDFSLSNRNSRNIKLSLSDFRDVFLAFLNSATVSWIIIFVLLYVALPCVTSVPRSVSNVRNK